MKTFLNHLQAIALLPFMVTVVIPAVILNRADSVNVGSSVSLPVRWILITTGILFIALGLMLVSKTIALFVRIGRGTLAPWLPTQKLVVHGIYRHVRNPMISGVVAILLGEASLFGSIALFDWFIFFIILNLIYMPLFEEPGLESRFGEDYMLYKRNVPRWIPRLKPWEPENR